VKAVSLLPTFKGDALTTIDTQLLSLQLVSGESLPLTINRAPGNVTNRQKMEDKFKSLVADLADESKLAIEWQYEELS
jgi:hypothetical protein